jgi:hypothetical protein
MKDNLQTREDVRELADDKLAAERYIRDWCPDHVKDYIASLACHSALSTVNVEQAQVEQIIDDLAPACMWPAPDAVEARKDLMWRFYKRLSTATASPVNVDALREALGKANVELRLIEALSDNADIAKAARIAADAAAAALSTKAQLSMEGLEG